MTTKLANKTLYLAAIGLSIFLLFFVVTSVWIGFDVKDQCQKAQRKYPGDCVEALVATLDDATNDFRTRNSAIWALGQLGDARALPTLEKYYTADIPEKESLDKVISQYELKKAITLTSGGANLTAVIWRFGN